MIVSNFEINARPVGESYSTAAYRLQITNLAKSSIEFVIETHVQKHQDGNPNLPYIHARLDYNPDKYPDLATHWISEGPVWVDRQNFVLQPGMSTVFELAPSWLLASDSHFLTMLGHVVLRVPPVRSRARFAVLVQSEEPIPVLLTPSRVEFAGHGGPTVKPIFAASIPTSTGESLNYLDPEGFQLVDVIGAVTKISDYAPDPCGMGHNELRGAIDIAPEDRVAALVDLLSNLEHDEETISVLNQALHQLGANVSLRGA